MQPTRKSAGKKATDRTVPLQRKRRHPMARLHTEMACDTAFRLVARRCLQDLTVHHRATCRGDATALHQMRIAVARLRTAILFFSPMVADPERERIRNELKRLNSQLGVLRDLDVAITRLSEIDERRPLAEPYFRSWNAKRKESHRQLVRALQSTKYRRLIDSISGWVENGPWSIQKGKQAAKKRASPVVAYSSGKLERWQQKLLKKCSGLAGMDTKKRHRLRLLNKKISYSIEFFEDLFPDRRFSVQRAALKHLRKAQRCLGRLNDDANGHALAATLQRDGVRAPLQFLSPKREERLIRTAAAAYRKLAALKA